jgi:dTDP-4-amino-4,6-dideoxygalactose transaminase
MGTTGLSGLAALEAECAALHRRRHAVALGRGTWALALVLRAIGERVRRRRLALPSFLCQTPLAGLLAAGWEPLFVDVDPATGLVPDTEWQEAARLGAGAMMPVHLFGNPVGLGPLASLCRAQGIFLIEDACQAVGARAEGLPCGAQGDAAILSFGHTKTIDAGSGGMLLTDDESLAAAIAGAAAGGTYPDDAQYDAQSAAASKQFYAAKERLAAEDPVAALRGAIAPWQALVAARWRADPGTIGQALASLPQAAAERRRKSALYSALLEGTPVTPLPMAPGAAPWRFCFRLPGFDRARQQALAATLRAQGIHVSNWYLPTHWMAPQPALSTGALGGTLQLHAEIFQLWLDPATDDARIRAGASALRKALAA